MRVLVISKTSFNVIQYDTVSNIAYSSGTYTITNNGTNYTYAASDYIVNILV